MAEDRKETMMQNHQGSGDNVAGNKTVNNYYAANNTANTNSVNNEVIELWREKLAYFQQQEAIASDAAQKFQLKKQIQECQQKITELGG